MTINSVSTLNTTQMLITQLEGQSSNLNTLSEQLASEKQHDDLTDYSPSDAFNLLNLQSSASERQSYLGVIQTTQSRLSGYDTTMTDMESIISQAKTLVDGSENYDPATASSIAATATSYLQSVGIDLNQQIDGRYIYAGSRYTTAPVVDLATANITPSTTIYTDNSTLPAYDTAYTTTGSTSTAAYATDSATIGAGDSVQYGVSSDNPAFQQLIAGLQFLQAAGNSTDSATYTSNMNNAATLLGSALTGIQAVHTGVANNINTLKAESASQSTQLADIANQVDDIQGVDVTQVSAEITALQTILEASYTVTGDLEKMTIASYI